MPTTLTGLLLFVVALLPGFAYLVGKERHGTERRLSPFRETVAIFSASAISGIIVLVIFAMIRALWPSGTPNVGALLSQGNLYLLGNRSHHGHYQIFAVWGSCSWSVPWRSHMQPQSLACGESADGFLARIRMNPPYLPGGSYSSGGKKHGEYKSSAALMTARQFVDSSAHSISRQMIHLTEILY